MDVPLRQSAAVRANAKINLTLDITGKREDGYHFMYMIMQSVDLADMVTVKLSDGDRIHVTCTGDPIEEENNTAYRAANVFFTACEIAPRGLDIHIEKNIPMMAGMAGGSADAAAVLTALDLMFGTELTHSELCMMGAQVGADVPFCLTGGTMVVEGIGEIFTPLPPLPECYIVIAKPGDDMRTENSFQLYDELEFPPEDHPDNEQMFAAIVTGDLGEIAGCMYNVLEEVAPQEPVRRIKSVLMDCGALGACMTGSGTATFGIFESKGDAKHAVRELSDIYDDVFLVEPASCGVEVVE